MHFDVKSIVKFLIILAIAVAVGYLISTYLIK